MTANLIAGEHKGDHLGKPVGVDRVDPACRFDRVPEGAQHFELPVLIGEKSVSWGRESFIPDDGPYASSSDPEFPSALPAMSSLIATSRHLP